MPRANEIKINVEQKNDYLNLHVAVNVARQFHYVFFDCGSIPPEYSCICA